MDPTYFLELAFRELSLFAAAGFLIGSVEEALIDLIWLSRVSWRGLVPQPGSLSIPSNPPARLEMTRQFAVFVPAWDESKVIGPMLDGALKAYAGDRVHIFVGCYRNDLATFETANQRAGPKLSVVTVLADGPTTKAHCLNELYSALEAHEQSRGEGFAGVILHDAEDVISAEEIRVFDTWFDRYAMIQLPVIPLPDRESRWVGGHYCDEFAESHSKTLFVRQALGAALPGAGVGCMIRLEALRQMADRTDGRPFPPDSLTEDYEFGLRLGEAGFNAGFLRITSPGPFGVIATLAHFPATLKEAVLQKARWTAGIGLAGWDRLGWGQGWAERWMRLRDRRGLLAAVVLFSSYLAIIIGALLITSHFILGSPTPEIGSVLQILIHINGVFLMWRLGLRAYFVTKVYGWREGCTSLPRAVVSNVINVLAARKAVSRYLSMRRRGTVEWDKTAHKYPEVAAD